MAASERSDHELIELVRSGDLAALGALYERHHEAGLRVARAVTGESHRAEDLVSDAFERIHRAIQRGGGPDESFRAYLYTVIRRLAIEHGTASARLEDTDDFAPYEAVTAVDDGTERSAEATIVAAAFAALPPRHQAVLWYVDVEGMSTAEAATFFGLSANATAALANRARGALKDAYLQAHVSGTGVAEACLPVRGKLGPYRAGSLSARDTAKVEAHLDQCDECPVVLAELTDVSHGLRVIIAPLIIGGVAAAAVFGTPAPQAMAGVVPISGRSMRRTTIAAAAAVALVAVGSIVLATTLSPGSPEADAAAVASVGSSSSPTAAPPTATRTTAPPVATADSVRETAAPTATPRRTPPGAAPLAPSATPTPTRAPQFLAAFLDAGDLVLGRVGVVAIDIANVGGAAGASTLDITIPVGVELDATRPLSTSGGIDWTCTPAAGLIRCAAPAAPADSTSTVYAPVTVSADAAVDGFPSATVAASGATTITATATAGVVPEGLGTRFLATGDYAVVHAGASLLSCDAAEDGCLDARQRVGEALDNNDWDMIAIDAAGLGVPSSSAMVDIPAGATVRFAGLYWSGLMPHDADPAVVGLATVAAPGGAPTAIIATELERQGSRYFSFVDVTSRVAAGGAGAWSFGSAAVTGGLAADAGWSLVIVLEDSALTPTRVAVFDGLQVIAANSAATFTLPSAPGGSATVGVVGWDGDAGLDGDAVLVDEIPLTRVASGLDDNAFASWADGTVPITPGDTNSFGFDTGVFAPVTTNGTRAAVEVATTNDVVFLGVVTLVTR